MSAAALREPWTRLSRQREAATFGMWVFLTSELLFFSGMILIYAACRYLHPAGFLAGARETNVWFGTINTMALLTSSFTMAVAAQAGDARLRRLAIICLAATAALGLAFLTIKGFEYREDIQHHLLPGADFAIAAPGAELFFSIYWVMTGVHGIHLSSRSRPGRAPRCGDRAARTAAVQPGNPGDSPLLAPRGRHLDYPLPAPLSRRSIVSLERADDKGTAASGAVIWRRNLVVWATLMLLVLLTLGLAYLPLGRFNLPLALLIAAAKAVLIGVIFMELRLAEGLHSSGRRSRLSMDRRHVRADVLRSGIPHGLRAGGGRRGIVFARAEAAGHA